MVLRGMWLGCCLMLLGCGIQQQRQQSIALTKAVAAGDDAQMEALLQQGANPHYRNKKNLSAFATAGKYNRARVVKRFLDLGARPEVDPIAYILTTSPIVFSLLDQNWSEQQAKYKPSRAEPRPSGEDAQSKLVFGVQWAKVLWVKNALRDGADANGFFAGEQRLLDFAQQQAELAAEVGLDATPYQQVVDTLQAELMQPEDAQE